ncbi:MAG TPA: chalcone isomerase family protein [Burkholderiaceae bacterium]|nr:chalcone isomerase family protein [Burkholderiaceae bacterium]
MKHRFLALSLACAAWLACASAPAAVLEGVQFDDAVKLGDSELRLNGLGLRAVFVIKGYAAGLYLTERAPTAAAVLQAKGPKRLQIRMLREARPADFNKALVSGMRKNATEAELRTLSDRIDQLERIIESIGGTKKGDTINLDFIPERGTTLSMNGAVKGDAIGGIDFYNALLEIFVGDHPVDAKLKKGLLGLYQ